MNQQSRFIIVITFLLAGICSSCTTRRYAVSKRAERLSSKLGVQVTPKDNLELYDMVAGWLGTPYRMGQSSRKGTDCSGFVSVVYKNVYGKELARSSAAMLRLNCRPVRNRAKLREGNLVFFHTTPNSKLPSHVGIYLKDRKFAHASSSRGVTISSLDESYYRSRWLSGGVVK
ncbi:MAG: C40 family peptidase [Tannerella sp.]|jgi:cell wall-associated NlpC family hydrolase|nr:C40 family peptidase [Tannerella sp.]